MIEAPTVVAYREDGQLVITCPHCDGEHTHGIRGPELGSGNGFRIAHCLSGGSRSYFIKEFGS